MPKRIVDTANLKVDSNKQEVLDRIEQVAPQILTEWALKAERYAKEEAPVDTGRLKNSITWALGGKGATTASYTSSSTHGSNKNTVKRGIAGKPAPPPHEGSYSGTAPKDSEGKYSVYVGTNVEYAQYVELGTSRMSAQPFLKPAIVNHTSEYMDILKEYLDKVKEGT